MRSTSHPRDPTPADPSRPSFRVLQFLIYAVIFAALLAGGWLLYVKVQESGTPQWKAPDVHTPDWKWPNWKAPDWKAPDWKAPNIHMPSWSWPSLPSWGGKTPGPSPAPEPSPAPAPSPHKPEHHKPEHHKPEHHKPEHHKKEHHHEMTEEEKEAFWFDSHSEEWKANYLAAHNATGDNSTAVLDNLGDSTKLAFTVEPGTGSTRPTGPGIAELPLI